jgi:hypothetical protein
MTHSEATVRGHRAMEFSSGNEALQTLALYEGSRGRFHQSQLNGGEKTRRRQALAQAPQGTHARVTDPRAVATIQPCFPRDR